MAAMRSFLESPAPRLCHARVHPDPGASTQLSSCAVPFAGTKGTAHCTARTTPLSTQRSGIQSRAVSHCTLSARQAAPPNASASGPHLTTMGRLLRCQLTLTRQTPVGPTSISGPVHWSRLQPRCSLSASASLAMEDRAAGGPHLTTMGMTGARLEWPLPVGAHACPTGSPVQALQCQLSTMRLPSVGPTISCAASTHRSALMAQPSHGCCCCMAADNAAVLHASTQSAQHEHAEPSTQSAQSAAQENAELSESADFIVVNFYKLVNIDDPEGIVATHLQFVEDLDIKGRIYISHQGINAQFSGPRSDAVAYSEWVQQDKRHFADITLQISPSPDGHAFPRLRLRYKPSLVQVAGGTEKLPLTKPETRAVPLSPAQWRQRIASALANAESVPNPATTHQEAEAQNGGGVGGSDMQHEGEGRRQVVVLDVRNGYEWDIGHFEGAIRPPVDNFRSTEFGLRPNGADEYFEASESEVPAPTTSREPQGEPKDPLAKEPQQQYGPRAISPEPQGEPKDPLAGVDKENTDILMYCTGGIRCDVYSTLLRERGFRNLYTLEGGVAKYLKEEGSSFWKGHLFVFDSRLAVHPKAYRAGEEGVVEGRRRGNREGEWEGEGEGAEGAFINCMGCGGALEQVRHRNCANPLCNALMLVCSECALKRKGACSEECASSPRLRPFLVNPEPYKRSHWYLSPEQQKASRPPGFVSKRAIKRRKRREARRAALMDQNNGDEATARTDL